ncbi:integrase arm-type DNA-binding domain-containing protein [Brenneria goodwinii]
MALTDAVARQARTTGKAYTLNDSDGLSLFVTANGAKKWHFRFSLQGKQQRISLGSYPGHGFRATISTALNELGYPKEWIEVQLSHADPNKIRAANKLWPSTSIGHTPPEFGASLENPIEIHRLLKIVCFF